MLVLFLFLPSLALSSHKFQYKLSFKKPTLIAGSIPFFTHSQNVLLNPNQIALTKSSHPSSMGAVWSQNPVDLTQWQLQVDLEVKGAGWMGEQGIALWYAPVIPQGSFYGSLNQWKGLGIFMDTSVVVLLDLLLLLL